MCGGENEHEHENVGNSSRSSHSSVYVRENAYRKNVHIFVYISSDKFNAWHQQPNQIACFA